MQKIKVIPVAILMVILFGAAFSAVGIASTQSWGWTPELPILQPPDTQPDTPEAEAPAPSEDRHCGGWWDRRPQCIGHVVEIKNFGASETETEVPETVMDECQSETCEEYKRKYISCTELSEQIITQQREATEIYERKLKQILPSSDVSGGTTSPCKACEENLATYKEYKDKHSACAELTEEINRWLNKKDRESFALIHQTRHTKRFSTNAYLQKQDDAISDLKTMKQTHIHQMEQLQQEAPAPPAHDDALAQQCQSCKGDLMDDKEYMDKYLTCIEFAKVKQKYETLELWRFGISYSEPPTYQPVFTPSW